MSGRVVLKSGSDFALVRLNADGSLDKQVITDVAGNFDAADGMLLQPDGKIIVGGSSFGAVLTLARYNPDLSLDSSFSGDGTRSVSVPGFTAADTEAIALQGDKILLAGNVFLGGNDQDFLLMRFNLDGSTDSSFDGDGIVVTSFGTLADVAFDLAVQPDGKIITAGCVNAGSLGVARFNPNGGLDAGFDGDGKLTDTLLRCASAVRVDAEGRVLLAGSRTSAAGNADVALLRLQANGQPDGSFGNGGRLGVPVSSNMDDFGFDLALQADGRIVVAGATRLTASNQAIAALRFWP